MRGTGFLRNALLGVAFGLLASAAPAQQTPPAQAQAAKPSILLIVGGVGNGDLGVYGGGPGRGLPTPSLDRMTAEGMAFFSNYAQPNLPAQEFQNRSMARAKLADSIVELDTRVGRVLAKLRELGLDRNTLVVFTTDNGAWQDVDPDAGYTPFRGTKGTVREGDNRVPMIASWPDRIAPGARNHELIRRA